MKLLTEPMPVQVPDREGEPDWDVNNFPGVTPPGGWPEPPPPPPPPRR